MTVAIELDIEGPAAPPRSNGELVFAAPWEGRAFGLTMALVHGRVISYESFRTALIERIAAEEAKVPAGPAFHYYRCWLQALEDVLADADLLAGEEIATRVAVFAGRPAGHDHRHDDHEHPHAGG